MVEFSLVFPILLMLFLFIVDFGWAWHQEHKLVQVSREGARLACVYDEDSSITTTSVTTKIRSLLENIGFNQYAEVGVDVQGADAAIGADVSVTLSYNHTYLFLDKFLPGVTNPVLLTARTVMRHE